MKLAVCLAFLVLVPTPLSAQKPDPAQYGDWIQVEIRGFTFYSDLKPRELEEQVLAFTRLQEILENEVHLKSARPSHVYVFSRHADALPFFAASRLGGRQNLAGVFIPRNDANYIVIDASAGARPLRIIYHEYLHSLVNAAFESVPVWFNEGIAEYFSSFVSGKDFIEIGRPIPEHMAVVSTAPLYDIPQLFQIDHDSPEYNESSRTGILYAQSWALVHYLLVGRPGHEVDWTRFLKILTDGVEQGEALELAFGVDQRGLNEEIVKYAASEKWPSRRIRVEAAPGFDVDAAKPLAAADALFRLGDLMHHMDPDGNVEESTPWFQAALQVAPDHEKARNALLRLGEYIPEAGAESAITDPDQILRDINALIEAGRLDSALALAKDLIRRTADPDLREDLRGQLVELEKAVEHNHLVAEYNEAVKMANEGQNVAAVRILREILPKITDADLKEEARKLLDQLLQQ
jgi:tetratricopeptide (TPR) repeat protein